MLFAGKNIIPKPVTKGYVNVPLVIQMEELECGAAALAMILHYYRYWIPLEQARADCGVSMAGVNAKNIIEAARSYGLTAKGWHVEAEELKKDGPFPCIIHWGFNHFVVLCGFKGEKAVINDPARGKINVDWEEFDREYTGVSLFLEPSEEFKPMGHPKSILEYSKEKLKGTGSAIVFAVITTSVASLLQIAKPAFAKTFIDRLLPGDEPDYLKFFILLFLLFTLATVVTEFISAIFSLKIEAKLAAKGSSNYLWKVLHLPMLFFSQRHVSDISERQTMNASVANTLIQTFAPQILQLFMLIIYLVIMIRYSLILTLIGVGAIFLNLLFSVLFTVKRNNLARVTQRNEAALSSETMSGITLIETIKASGSERGFFSRWSGYQARVNNQKIQNTKLDLLLNTIPYSITVLANIIVFGIGVLLIINRHFTSGMLMAFQGYLSAFMNPAVSLISAGQSIQEMKTKMERIDDVMNYPEDAVFNAQNEAQSVSKLSGKIELDHVSFGYSKRGKPLFEDLSLSIKPGSKTAIVGRSGCGKSTLVKLISGLYQPDSGNIKIDGHALTDIDRKTRLSSISVVDQESVLFDDTVLENIRLWDDSISGDSVEKAIKDAWFYYDIKAYDDYLMHRILDGGQNLSGGQRQRLEIARALSREPSILILDEATSALDSETESKIMKAIKARNITTIIVSHRLSTIKDCDEIIVIDHGNIVQRGTHDELFSRKGLYKELVSNE